IVRNSSHHRIMTIEPTRWQWHKVKEWMYFYFYLGAIPVGIVIFCANVFIGPATLTAIPEGYIPKQWEYHRTPVTRFFSRYLSQNRQQDYEKILHYRMQQTEIRQIRKLEKEIKDMIRSKQDYPAFSYSKSLRATEIKKLREHIDKNTFQV
ncbi:NADH dehydrogenase [ubiquinone] 1 beta subcomplex subunit 5, mitochondrial, partial [Dufourea novaeangliae]